MHGGSSAILIFMTRVVSLLAFAAPVALSTTAFAATSPGAPMTVRLHADAPGLVRLRAPDGLGVDWPAPGRGAVDVPWMTWRAIDGPVEVEINGTAATVTPRPAEAQPLLGGPAEATPSDAAYVPTTAWAPGRDAAVRRWAVGAAVAAVLLIAAAALLTHGRRFSTALVVAVSLAITAAAAVAPAFRRQHASLRVGVAIEQDSSSQHDLWTYRTARTAARVREPWGGGLARGASWFVPRWPGHVARADPVLELNAAGRPVAIVVGVTPDEPAAFLHRSRATAGGPSPRFDDATTAPELVRRLYAAPASARGDWAVVGAP
jgi:hypothetical protein